jgi:hypothetical protein
MRRGQPFEVLRRCPIGAATFTATPISASIRVISATSSRWRKPSAVGPSRLTLGWSVLSQGRASARTSWKKVSSVPKFSFR